jgi:hypothetical protein
MKPTVTNCFDCWTEDQRVTPATWAVADEFFCEGHFRKAGLDPSGAVTIEAYKAAHGLDQPHPSGDPSKFNGKASRKCRCGRNLQHGTSFDLCAKCRRAKKTESPEKQEQEKKPMKNQQELSVRTCSVDDCGKVLRPSNTSGRCTKHWYQRKGVARKTTSKAPRKTASRPAPSPETEASQDVPESAHIALTRDQLVALFTSWPIARQAAAVQAVFVQELSLA